MIILFGAVLCHTSNRDELLLSVSFLVRIRGQWINDRGNCLALHVLPY